MPLRGENLYFIECKLGLHFNCYTTELGGTRKMVKKKEKVYL